MGFWGGEFGDVMLTFMGLCMGSYLGDYIRLGISYFKIYRVETNFTVMYAQVIGCLIMGFVTHHKTWCFNGGSRLKRILFVSLTTGLCGSITTFSAWNYECNKHFFLQWDISWGNDIGSFNGGRFFEWCVCLWSGVALPLSALLVGQHLARPSPKGNKKMKKAGESAQEKFDDQELTPMELALEILFIFSFIAASLVAILTPGLTGWTHLAWSSFFACVGTYFRYLLSFLNPRFKNFPLGTFIANVFGSWLMAAFLTISKFAVPYNHHASLAALYGLTNGFCGCLTTVSTFVNELDRLPVKYKYIYGFSSYITAQAGFILFLNIFSYTQIDKSTVMPPPLDFCTSYEDLCTKLMDHLECPKDMRVINPCKKMPKDGHDPGEAAATFIGDCTCGNFYASERIAELLVDSQLRQNVTAGLVPMWPSKDTTYYKDSDPSETVDFCLVFENNCDHWLNRIGCPHSQRQNIGCGSDHHGAIDEYHAVCGCGDLSEIPSTRVAEVNVDLLLFRRYDMFPYKTFPTDKGTTFNYCKAYKTVCHQLLDHIQCPLTSRDVNGCDDDKDYETFEGVCSCRRNLNVTDGVAWFDVGDERVGEVILDATVKTSWYELMEVTSPGKIDPCISYHRYCKRFLDQIGCPKKSYHAPSPCGPKGGIAHWEEITDEVDRCSCAGIDVSSERMRELVIDATLARDFIDYKYIPLPISPYTLTAMSNPFRILMQPKNAPLPN